MDAVKPKIVVLGSHLSADAVANVVVKPIRQLRSLRVRRECRARTFTSEAVSVG